MIFVSDNFCTACHVFLYNGDDIFNASIRKLAGADLSFRLYHAKYTQSYLLSRDKYQVQRRQLGTEETNERMVGIGDETPIPYTMMIIGLGNSEIFSRDAFDVCNMINPIVIKNSDTTGRWSASR